MSWMIHESKGRIWCKDMAKPNNQIIFKGWNYPSKSWVEGGVVTINGQYYIVQARLNIFSCLGNSDIDVKFVEVIRESICPYIGFSDQLGTKIFSNDIITVDNKTYIGVVKQGVYNTDWDAQAGHCGFYIEWQNRSGLRKDLGFWVNQRDIAVVGNVFDSKELLRW